ncbi:YHS domain-containing protein [Pedobacter montanisoli]|uniref:YHS domain-containing protein n=1 Tax=Pedobacter montanisoli TaxID=2923277 RepID=A0ABS9ZYP6_9SPHI|nr:YHS domain-containing protein [Pedobacter montanisoli]MCJ0743451.1 YHS domain-containing protein [Pedobacter montanisoli]
MKKVLFIAAFAIFSQFAKAQSVKQQTLPTDTTEQAIEIDPVCKMKVKTEKAISFIYHKKSYYFCSESCKKAFSSAPEKYIKK